MNNNSTWPYVAIGLLLGWIIGNQLIEAFGIDSEPDCKQMAVELWAFKQCLANRPACQLQGGQQAYVDHHNMRLRFEEQCGEDRGDSFLEQ